MAPRFLAKQLSHPSGLMGRLVGRLMNRGNANVSAYAIEQLEIGRADRVLEIGFGGGATLPLLLGAAGFVAGLDRSRTMVEAARTRHAGSVEAGRLDIREGLVEAMPFADASFDRVLTVNTVYFWRSLAAGFAEIHRVLAPGGRVAVGFLPRERMAPLGMPADIFTMRTPDEVAAALGASGFTHVRVARPRPTTAWNVVVATRGA